MTTLTGRLIHNPRFYSSGGHLIGSIAVSKDDPEYEKRKYATVKGELPKAVFGETYVFEGEWTKHPDYGEQFLFEKAKLQIPVDPEGIRTFLENCMKWCGGPISKAIVDEYGADTIEVLRDDPMRVAREISYITPDRATEISDRLKLEGEMVEARIKLENFFLRHGSGLPTKRLIPQLLSEMGTAAPSLIEENPYRLTEFWGIGFKRADGVALSMGGDPDSPDRLARACVYFVEQEAANGHTVISVRSLCDQVARYTDGHNPQPIIDKPRESWPVAMRCLDRADGEIWHTDYAEYESAVARLVVSLIGRNRIEKEPKGFSKLAPDQVAAWKLIRENNLSILTGPPGTGKTTLIGEVCTCFEPDDIRLAAPAGIAGKNLAESISKAVGETVEGQTIHRLLGARPWKGDWKYEHNEENPMWGRVFILDEVSMLDTELFYRFLVALPGNARVILVGDEDQLPSVGAGSVLRDLIGANIPHARLTQIKRNAGDLLLGIHAIKAGREPSWSPYLWKSPRRDEHGHLIYGEDDKPILDDDESANLWFIEKPSDRIWKTIKELLKKLSQKGINPREDVQVLSPVKTRGPVSVKEMNFLLRRYLMVTDSSNYLVGEKVINVKNRAVECADSDESAYVFNGDMGRVVELEGNHYVVQHTFPDRLVKYERGDKKLQLAWCLTVHKVQGSQFPVVIMPIDSSFLVPIWTRNLVYTMLSRAQKLAICVGERGTFIRALPKVETDNRLTTLKRKIIEAELEGI